MEIIVQMNDQTQVNIRLRQQITEKQNGNDCTDEWTDRSSEYQTRAKNDGKTE